MKKQKGRRQRKEFLLLYTILFAITCVLVFWYFPAQEKRMVWRGDGLSQHYVALCYYARWGRAVIRSILAGKPSFPTFNMHMGFGADLFTTLQYYVIGDPFSLPAVLVPQKYMLIFHDAMILVRMYIAGICFDSYCREMGHCNTQGNLCGSLIYVFSSYVLFGMRHPYFLNAMIWFPILLIGAEHIFRGRKGRLFTAAVFLACISNFYFFYMLVFMTVIYAVWRALRICLFPVLAENHGEKGGREQSVADAMKEVLSFAGKFLLRAVLGVAMGAFFLLPIVLRFLQDPRASEGVEYGLLYPASYYEGILESFTGFGAEAVVENWTCLGVGGIGLLGVLLLFIGGVKDRKGRREQHPDLKIAFVFMFLLTLLPAAGAALNGFTYPANRWIWAFCMLTAYIAAVMLPSLLSVSGGRMALIMLFMSVYAALCALFEARLSTILELILCAAIAAAVWAAGNLTRKNRQAVLAGCGAALTLAVVVTSTVHAYVCFAVGVRYSGMEDYHTDRYIDAMMASDAAGMRKLLGNDFFYRYSGRYISNNFALLNDVSDTQYYWSLSDSRVNRFFTETGQYNEMVHLFDNLDNRTMLDEIAGVGYYRQSDKSLLPFGYEKMKGMHFDNRKLFDEREGESLPVFFFTVYKNKYTLPLGFTTDKYLTRETYDALTIPQRQEALMQGILLEDEGVEKIEAAGFTAADSGIEETDLSFTEEEIPFTARAEDGIEIRQKEDGSVEVTVRDPEAVLKLDVNDKESLSQKEINVLLTGMSYAASEKVSEKASEKLSEKVSLDTSEEEPRYTASDPVKIRVIAEKEGKTVSDKTVMYTLPDNPWTTGRTDFMSCCGYTEEPLSELYMQFERRGVYTFRELKVIGQPMEDYPAQAQKLGEYTMQDLNLNELKGSGATNKITGTLTCPDQRLLCIQIPCCEGLRAYVDGEEVPLLQADTMFSAVAVEAGTHEIELRYRTPGLAAGAGISAAGFLIAAAETVILLLRKKKKR